MQKGLKLSLMPWVGVIGSICSTISFFTVKIFPDGYQAAIYIGSQGVLMFSLVCLTVYVVILRERSLTSLREKNIQMNELGGKIQKLNDRLSRMAEFAHAHEELHRIFHELRNALLKLSDPDKNIQERAKEADDLFLVFFQRVVDTLQKIFAKTADPKCRVCVKQIRERNAECVQTLCRDAGSQEHYSGELTRVDQNTDFHYIIQKVAGFDRYFFSNDLLQWGKKYRNSHPTWQNDYRSTIVWPIRGPRVDSPTGDDVAGFLCVDSLQTNIFDSKISVEMGAAVADMLYILLFTVDTVKKKADKERETQ